MFGNDTPIYHTTGPFRVPIEIHASILFLGFIFFGLDLSSPQVVIHGVILFAMVVVSILLHELGHAWGAWIQGVPVRRVVLYGGGGYCEHANSTADESELIVIMGPLVNLALWAVSSLLGWWLFAQMVQHATVDAADSAVSQSQFMLIYWLQTFASINLFLFVMNMVPVQPLDGGRLLHLALLRCVPQDVAMRLVGGVGLMCATLWVPVMILVYFTFGWALLFVPSLWVHWHLMRGNVPV